VAVVPQDKPGGCEYGPPGTGDPTGAAMHSIDFGFHGPTALVTGAASGTGRAIAVELARSAAAGSVAGVDLLVDGGHLIW
jgi:hypothetical protein